MLLCVIVQRGSLEGRTLSSCTPQFAEMLPSSPRPHPACWQILQAAPRLGGSLLSSHSAIADQGRFIALCFITSQSSPLTPHPQSILYTLAGGILLKFKSLFCSKSCHGPPFPSAGKPESSQQPVGTCVRRCPPPPNPPLPGLVPSTLCPEISSLLAILKHIKPTPIPRALHSLFPLLESSSPRFPHGLSHTTVLHGADPVYFI